MLMSGEDRQETSSQRKYIPDYHVQNKLTELWAAEQAYITPPSSFPCLHINSLKPFLIIKGFKQRPIMNSHVYSKGMLNCPGDEISIFLNESAQNSYF